MTLPPPFARAARIRGPPTECLPRSRSGPIVHGKRAAGVRPAFYEACQCTSTDLPSSPRFGLDHDLAFKATLSPPEWRDGSDNDGDGLTDYRDDQGCASDEDYSEAPSAPQCSDGLDDNSDGEDELPRRPRLYVGQRRLRVS